MSPLGQISHSPLKGDTVMTLGSVEQGRLFDKPPSQHIYMSKMKSIVHSLHVSDYYTFPLNRGGMLIPANNGI